MGKFLKENWFVAVVAVFFLVISVYFAYDQNKDKLPGKRVGGEDVVFAIDNQNTTANKLYDSLSKVYFNDKLFMEYQKALLDKLVPTTDEMTSEVNNTVDYYVNVYQSYYGLGIEYLNSYAQQNGYSTFFDYILYSRKAENVYSDYVGEHINEYYTDSFNEKYLPRIIRYCVITVADIEKPTEDEQKKIDEAKAAWASDEYTTNNFADFATKYTQDSGSSNGGLFGYLDSKTTGIDETFLKTALELEEGEVSDWVSSKDFGYFLIKCDSLKLDDLKKESGFISSILSANEGLDKKIIKLKADEVGVTYASDDIKNIIEKYFEESEEHDHE